MTPRWGVIFYRVAGVVAALAIVAAVAWNAWTLAQHQQTQAELRALSLERRQLATALGDILAQKRATTARLERSLSYGGALLLGGVIVYGLGWAIRRAAARRTEAGGSDGEGDDR